MCGSDSVAHFHGPPFSPPSLSRLFGEMGWADVSQRTADRRRGGASAWDVSILSYYRSLCAVNIFDAGHLAMIDNECFVS
jgi:hypothetical protein